jgi:hypothetical protein
MIEYDYGDSEELTHKTVQRYIVTANTTAIDQLVGIQSVMSPVDLIE